MRQMIKQFLSVAGVAAGLALAASPAHAVYTITLTETGGNVVATGTGTINITGLTNVGMLVPAERPLSVRRVQ